MVLDLINFLLLASSKVELSTLLCKTYDLISIWMICAISTFMHVPGSCYLFDFVDMPNMFMLRGAEQGWRIHDEGLRTTTGAFLTCGPA